MALLNSTWVLTAKLDKYTEMMFHYDHHFLGEALEDFWHNDYPAELEDHDNSDQFPIDIIAIPDADGQAEGLFPLKRITFNAAVFHAYFDHGHKADGPYEWEDFVKDIECKDNAEREIIALWSDWCMDWDDEDLWLEYMVKHPKAHCNRRHIQEKWDYCYKKYGSKAAMTMFWRELDNDNRDILTEYITTQWHKK